MSTKTDQQSVDTKQKAKNACVFCDYVKDNKNNNETKQYVLKRFKKFFRRFRRKRRNVCNRTRAKRFCKKDF